MPNELDGVTGQQTMPASLYHRKDVLGRKLLFLNLKIWECQYNIEAAALAFKK